MDPASAKLIGAGLAAIGTGAAAIGVGNLFGQFLQGALRNPDDPTHAAIVAAIENRTMVQVELLYSDQVGGERTITRFGLSPMEDGSWLCGVSRHFYLDWAGPRSDDMLQAAADRIRQEREASEQRNGDSGLSR